MESASVLRRILGRFRTAQTVTRPPSRNAFLATEQWYLPALAGPETFVSACVGADSVRQVQTVLEKLSPDRYLTFVQGFYAAGLERFGDAWVYADINTVLLGLSQVMRPTRYMEIGVRRGRSACMLGSHSPECAIIGFDMWIDNYAGMENPGADLVREELRRVGHRGSVEFRDGDSASTVPEYFRSNPDAFFDVITVDGDHSVAGARRDILAVMPRIRAGGVLVFDDTCNQSHPGLGELWERLVVDDPDFATYTFNDVGFGVGMAVRKR